VRLDLPGVDANGRGPGYQSSTRNEKTAPGEHDGKYACGVIPRRVSKLMLVGMALFRLGVLSARRSSEFYRWCAALGLLAGIPVVGYGAWSNFRAGWTVPYSLFFGSQFNYWGSVAAALGWIGLVMLWCRSARAMGVRRRIAAVGRMAVSNYIFQSVVGTLVFYGWGFGLFGRVERVGQLAIVLAVWAIQLILSPLWLRRHAYGPLEWLWRSITYGRLEPIRRLVGAST
jgi:uncharacterized protein